MRCFSLKRIFPSITENNIPFLKFQKNTVGIIIDSKRGGWGGERRMSSNDLKIMQFRSYFRFFRLLPEDYFFFSRRMMLISKKKIISRKIEL